MDDEIAVRTMMALALGSEGYEIDLAGNGLEALRRLENMAYDLIITDHLMPEMDGLDLIQKIKSKWPSMPVIIVSGTVPSCGFQQKEVMACIQKPFNVKNLQDHVKAILNVKGGHQVKQF